MKNSENLKIIKPRYHQIAVDIANKIVKGQYNVGDKLYARSVLASQYGVSAETARRAISLLNDLGVTESLKGSGVKVLSYEKALRFTKQNANTSKLRGIQNEMQESIKKQKAELDSLSNKLSEYLELTEHYSAFNPFHPNQIAIKANMKYVNKTIGEINFWQNTSATIVALQENDKLILSPGPYAPLTEGRVIFFIGDADCFGRVQDFLYE